MLSIRLLFAYSTITLFLLFFFFSGIAQDAKTVLSNLADDVAGGRIDFPDFSRYRELDTLSEEQFPIDSPDKRVILIGDVHGMHSDLQSLLTKMSYNPPSDVLISAGDIVAKGPLNGSLDVLSYMASNNVIAVRGNHDQKVIEWRTWIKWIHTLPSGKRWLRQTYSRFLEDLLALPGDEELDVDEWLENERKKDRKRNSKNKKWWNRIPEGWQLFGDHYRIADKMSEEEYEYMVSRPLKIHVPHAHVYIAHAGVLASNPKLKPYHKDQPLAKIPDLPKTDAEELKKDKGDKKKELLRKLQEIAVLKEVPQNRDPWVTLNMRGVLNDEVTRAKDGTPWSDLYKRDMNLCEGFDQNIHSTSHRKDALPCNPITVIYGHAASRGLDIKRWSIGLDSGCVYERRMSALVLGGRLAKDFDSDLDGFDPEDEGEYGAYNIKGKKLRSKIRFGDNGRGRIVSVPCSL